MKQEEKIQYDGSGLWIWEAILRAEILVQRFPMGYDDVLDSRRSLGGITVLS